MRHDGIVAGSIRVTSAHVPAVQPGLLARLTFAAVAVAATVVTVAVAATLLIVAMAIGPAALLVRTLRLRLSRRRPVSPAHWSGDTIDTTLAVNPQTRDSSASTTGDLVVQDNRER